MPGSVLLVHDDISAIAAARRVLVSEGLEVSLATSCADAFSSYQQRPYHLVVLAPALENGLGASVYDEIRSLPSGAKVRFVLLGSEIADAKGALVVDLPIDAEGFRSAVREALRSRADSLTGSRRIPRPVELEEAPSEPPTWSTPPADAPLSQQLFGRGVTPPPPGSPAAPAGEELVMPAVSIGEAPTPAPEPYAAVSPDGPTVEAPTFDGLINWSDLNVPSDEPADDPGRRPLTLTEPRPETVEAPLISAAREKRVLAEISAAAEIADRARAVTAPGRTVEKERPAQVEARAQSDAAAEHQRQLQEQEARHEAELAAALARLRDERDAHQAASAEVIELRAEAERLRLEREQEDRTRASSEEANRAANQTQLNEALHTLASLEDQLAGERQARSLLENRVEDERSARRLAEEELKAKEREAASRAEAEARAHSASQNLIELEQKAARIQAVLEGQRQAEVEAREAAEKRVEQAQQSLATSEQRADELAAHLASTEQARVELEQRLAATEQAQVELEDEVATLERAQAEREQQLEEARTSLVERDEQLEAERAAGAQREEGLREAQASLTERERELKALQASVEERDQQLAEAARTRAELERRLAEAERRAQERAERERAAEAEAAHEQQRLSETESAYQEIERQLGQQAHTRSEAELRARDLAAKRQALQTSLEEAEARSRAEAEHVAAQEDASDRVEAELVELERERTEAERLTQETAERRAELERGAAEALEQAVAQKKALEALAHQRAELEEAVAAQQANRTAAEARLQELAAKAEEHERAAATAGDLAEAERAQLAKLEAARAEADHRVEGEQKARAEAEHRAQALHAQRQKIQKDLAAATARAQAAATARAELEKVCADLEASLESGQNEKQAEEARVAELEKRARAEEERRSALEKTRLEALSKLKALAQERGQAEKAAHQAAAERDALARQAHDASARVQAEVAKVQQLEHTLAEATRRRELAQRAREAAEHKQADLAQQSEALQQQAEVAEREAQQQIERTAQLEQACHAADAQLLEELARQHTAREQVTLAEAEVAKLEAAAAEAEKRLEAVRAERHEAEAHAAAVAERRASFQATLARLEGELGTAEPVRSSGDEARPVTQPSPAVAPEEPAPRERGESEAERRQLEGVDDESTRRPTAPSRRVLRPLAGGRWRRAETGPHVRLPPEVEAVRPLPYSEGPVEARAPRFPTAGKLAEVGMAAFLAHCWQERVTGRFDFDCRDGARALYFEEGRLVAALSNAATERLEELAHRDGLITRAHVRALRPDAERMSARQLAVHLVELKLIKGTELYALVRRQMEEVAYALFADDTIEYLYGSDLAPPDLRVALPMTPLAFMVEGVRRKGDFDRLNPELGGPTARVKLVREGAPELAELGLSARERRLVALIDGLRTIEELIFASGLDPHAAVKLLYALRAAGAVETLAVEPQPAQEGSRDELRIDLTRVGEKYEQVRNGDYFEILGVSPDATSYEVRQAFERIIREFHPGRFTAVAEPGLSSRLDEIGRMVAEAADVLSDDVTRREYARNLTAG